jgi:hypothetical protein
LAYNQVNKADVPPNRWCIKSKWIFDIQRTGIFRARLVSCGYSQIPGTDFIDYKSPVVNDTVFHILILIQIMWNLTSVILDVEIDFLHGDVDEHIYMHAPKGTNLKSFQCVKLD